MVKHLSQENGGGPFCQQGKLSGVIYNTGAKTIRLQYLTIIHRSGGE